MDNPYVSALWSVVSFIREKPTLTFWCHFGFAMLFAILTAGSVALLVKSTVGFNDSLSNSTHAPSCGFSGYSPTNSSQQSKVCPGFIMGILITIIDAVLIVLWILFCIYGIPK